MTVPSPFEQPLGPSLPPGSDAVRKMRIAVVGGGNGGEPSSRPAARREWGGATAAARARSCCRPKLPEAARSLLLIAPRTPSPPRPRAARCAAAMVGQWVSKVDLLFSPKYADRAAALAAAIDRNGGLILHTK